MKNLSFEYCKKISGGGPYRPAKPKSSARIVVNMNKTEPSLTTVVP